MARTWKRTSDSCVAPDKPMPTIIAYRLTRNLAANAAELQVSTTHVYSAAGNRVPPTVSTHPEQWWGLAFVVPVAPGLGVIKATLRYTVQDASVKVRLYADGRYGSSSTLTTTGTDASVTVTIAVSDAVARRVRVLVAFQSQPAATALETITGVSATGRLTPSLHALECTTSGTYSGKQHLALKYSAGGTDRWIYIGTADSASGVLYTWLPSPIALDSADLHQVGNITVKSVGLRVMGDSSTGSFPVVSHGPMAANKVVRARDIIALWLAFWYILRDRALWWAAGAGLDSTSSMHGARPDKNAAACFATKREDAKGVEVTIIGVPSLDGAITATTRIKTLGGAVNATDTIRGTGRLLGNGLTMTEDVARYVAAGAWGAEDLVPTTELEGLSVISGRVEWPSGVAVADTATVTVESQQMLHTHGVCVREWYDDAPPAR